MTSTYNYPRNEDDSPSLTHPLPRGMIVTLYKAENGVAYVDIKARITGPLIGLPHRYRVIPLTGGAISERWVYPGCAQADPAAFLRNPDSMLTELRISLMSGTG